MSDPTAAPSPAPSGPGFFRLAYKYLSGPNLLARTGVLRHMFRKRSVVTDQTKAENRRAGGFERRAFAAFRTARRALVAIANYIPMRILVMIIGIMMFTTISTYVNYYSIRSIFPYRDEIPNDLRNNLGLLSEALKLFFLGYLILILLAKKIPRATAIFLLVLTCLFYGTFLVAHVVDPYYVLRPFRDNMPVVLIAMPILIVAEPAFEALKEIATSPFSFMGFVNAVVLFLRHLVYLLCLYLLYEAVFVAHKVGAPALERDADARSG